MWHKIVGIFDRIQYGFSSWKDDGCWHKSVYTKIGKGGLSDDCSKCGKHLSYSELGTYKGIPIIVSGQDGKDD